MKYWLDTEFIEGFHKPLFGKRRHFIDLISIGIVAEDGRKYYAISKDFNAKDADEWVKKNVISKLPERVVDFNGSSPSERRNAMLWKHNDEIARDIVQFVNPECMQQLQCGLWPDMEEVKLHNPDRKGNAQPEIYAYYADYDWVLFCSLFGRMIDLPTGFPMYCRDLKQMMDEAGLNENWKAICCPTASNEHNALSDAEWNKSLYEAIINETQTK